MTWHDPKSCAIMAMALAWATQGWQGCPPQGLVGHTVCHQAVVGHGGQQAGSGVPPLTQSFFNAGWPGPWVPTKLRIFGQPYGGSIASNPAVPAP